MADISYDFYEGINRWFEWENRLRDMSGFPMPNRYKAYNSTNEYNRFVGFLKEWVFERMKSAEKTTNGIGEVTGFQFKEVMGKDDIISNMTEEAFAMLSFKEIGDQRFEQKLDARVNDPNKFWKAAIASSGNRKINKSMPSIKGKHKKPVYDLFMPAYRALKDRFEQRSIWEWFTNHAQYTAERDSIKALEGIMRSLTGDSLETVTEQLRITRERMPVADRKECLKAEYRRLGDNEAAENLDKEQKITHNKNQVESIIVEDVIQDEKVSTSQPIVETNEKLHEKIK